MNEEERKQRVALNKARYDAAISELRKKPWGPDSVKAVDGKQAADELSVVFLSKSDVAFIMGALALHGAQLADSDTPQYTSSAARAAELIVNLGEQAFQGGAEQ